MSKDSNLNYLIEYVEDKIRPYTLNSIEKNNLSVLINEFSIDDIITAIDISYKNYITLDENGNINSNSVDVCYYSEYSTSILKLGICELYKSE